MHYDCYIGINKAVKWEMDCIQDLYKSKKGKMLLK